MSAAEAARPDAGPGPRTAGVVIPMSQHPAAHRRTSRPATRTPSRSDGDGPGRQPTAEQQLAEHMEALFHAHGMTLTDEQTADVYRIAIEAVELMLRGALVEGTLTEAAHGTLHTMLTSMRNAPSRL